MSKETEAQLEKEIIELEAKIARKRSALKEVRDKPLPLAFIAVVADGNILDDKRLCIRVTDSVKYAVDSGAEYITLCYNGGIGNKEADEEYIKSDYTIKEIIFE